MPCGSDQSTVHRTRPDDPGSQLNSSGSKIGNQIDKAIRTFAGREGTHEDNCGDGGTGDLTPGGWNCSGSLPLAVRNTFSSGTLRRLVHSSLTSSPQAMTLSARRASVRQSMSCVPVRSAGVGADGVEDKRMPTSNHGSDQVFHRIAPMGDDDRRFEAVQLGAKRNDEARVEAFCGLRSPRESE